LQNDVFFQIKVVLLVVGSFLGSVLEQPDLVVVYLNTVVAIIVKPMMLVYAPQQRLNVQVTSVLQLKFHLVFIVNYYVLFQLKPAMHFYLKRVKYRREMILIFITLLTVILLFYYYFSFYIYLIFLLACLVTIIYGFTLLATKISVNWYLTIFTRYYDLGILFN
jgi:hypothetical protein